ncbi:SEFIR domain-containing protein [Amycolatopsis sp. 195334CR]|uniref:SEFIR domain-containing protein n=1 Tax=Amycolatopsis sp. 195334CR TaxID=2814588 RepID=UPI001A8C38D9|nr:SEFIR domain-containing protein [Amycolatopsis sp. 195334CR]MBN6033354.1 TIR domain-containing protein [Amycolatopsis sp. 195334CR]
MPGQKVPRLFVTYAHDSPEHKKRVELFARFLRRQVGLDVHLDQWYDNLRRDWSAWAVEQLTEADFVVVIASPDYKRRADGAAPPHEGRGSQFETAMIRNELTKDLRAATERILPVVLRGQTADDIPTFLNAYSTTRFHVESFTDDGVAELLAAITGQGPHPMPERGEWRGGAPSRKIDRVLLANGVPWLASSAHVRSATAYINGVAYADSVVLRPFSGEVESLGFVEIELGAEYRRLTAVAGVLDDAEEPFQVGHFRIYLDGSPRQEYRAAHGQPVAVDVDVTGALKLRLEMSRPGVSPGGSLRPGRPPELAWGNPSLSP